MPNNIPVQQVAAYKIHEYVQSYSYESTDSQKVLSGTRILVATREFSTSGKLLKETVLGREGTSENMELYTYSQTGNLLQQASANSSGDTMFLIVMKYNERDSLTHAIIFSRGLAGLMQSSERWIEYDEKGNVRTDC